MDSVLDELKSGNFRLRKVETTRHVTSIDSPVYDALKRKIAQMRRSIGDDEQDDDDDDAFVTDVEWDTLDMPLYTRTREMVEIRKYNNDNKTQTDNGNKETKQSKEKKVVQIVINMEVTDEKFKRIMRILGGKGEKRKRKNTQT